MSAKSCKILQAHDGIKSDICAFLQLFASLLQMPQSEKNQFLDRIGSATRTMHRVTAPCTASDSDILRLVDLQQF